MKHFIIYTNLHKDKNLETTMYIRNHLLKWGHLCSILAGDKQDLKELGAVCDDVKEVCMTTLNTGIEDVKNADCMIVLGGDGTMLQAAGIARDHKIPIVGVNLGTLGYMTEIEPPSLEQALYDLANDNYKVESRMLLHGRVISEEKKTVEDWALNDIVISRSGSLQILKFNIYVNGLFLNDYHADGVIVTTPTGSTGYNLSAGGPIVEPQAKLIMLTPICPHTLNQRSIILSPEDEITIEIPKGRDGQAQVVEASFDGSNAVALSTGDRIIISKADKTAEFIRLNQVSFLEILHRKLSEK